MTEDELKRQERTSALDVLKARIEFAKYGFRGTLAGAFGSITAVLILAMIDGGLKVSLHPSVYITLMVSCATATIAFGYFSLLSLPEISADIVRGHVAFGRGALEEGKAKGEDSRANADANKS